MHSDLEKDPIPLRREEQVHRLKTAMVLYTLERALGHFVLDAQPEVADLTSSVVEEIESRYQRPGEETNSNLRKTVEQTYLSEIFRLALDAARNTASWDRLNELLQLCSTLEIYKIRNVVSHPNREFPECYFHRLAAIATDPLIQLLGLNDVLLSFRCAEDGQIDEPPEEWLNEVLPWAIQNNVPTQHDHSVTGLVGRKRELAQLRNLLKNQRVNTIAVTAPGGTGKTALALEVLHEIRLEAGFQETIDCIAFVSLRTEKLTATGIEKFGASETINELESELGEILKDLLGLESAEFTSIMDRCANRNVLLFIDNLETLLRDNSELFDQFNLKLPPAWRVLVTSRVSVTSATSLPLEPLRETAAYYLAKNYAGRTGAGEISKSTLDKIVASCNCNPLAIRLTVDLFNLGHPLPESIGVATQDALDFSYRNLINALSENSSRVLECLFLKEPSDSRQISELLTFSLEDTAEAIRQLFHTSLISRVTTEGPEKYTLNSSIRDLLQINPRNFQFRTDLAAHILRQETLAMEVDAEQETKDVYDWYYIPDTCPTPLKLLLAEAAPVLRKQSSDTNALKQLLTQFRQSAPMYEKSAEFHRFYAQILVHFRDRKGWESHYRKSLQLDEDNPATKSALAFAYSKDGMYEEAKVLFDELLEAGWGRLDKWKFASILVYRYAITLLYSKKYDELLEFTKKWKEGGELKDTLGSFRANAWKRKVEKKFKSDPEEAVDGMRRAVRIMDDVLLSSGYNVPKSKLTKNIIQQIAYCLTIRILDWDSELALEWLNFSDHHLRQILDTSSPNEIADLVSTLASISHNKNPFHTARWKAFTESFDTPDDIDVPFTEGEFIQARVCNIPSVAAGFPNFLFIEDGEKNRYFAHFSALIDNDWERWKKLSIGSTVGFVASSEIPDEGRSRRATMMTIA